VSVKTCPSTLVPEALVSAGIGAARVHPSLVAESQAEAASSGCGQDCLHEDEALGFALGQLSPAGHQRVLQHFDRCLVCQRVILEALHQVEGVDGARPGNGWLCNFTPGATLAQRFCIQRYIARGGMGEVYEAHDALLDEVVALKTVLVTASDDPRAQHRLRSEVQLTRRITHPNVCRVHDVHEHVFEDGMTFSFASMPLLRGQTLRQRLQRGSLAPTEVENLGRQLLSGLAAVHRAGVVHGDLKSDNVMLLAGTGALPRVVIIDFGLARAAATPARGSLGRSANGSPPYMAPERLRGAPSSPASDVYAVGVVLFEALTGQLPCGKHSDALRALAECHHAIPLRAPSHVRPGISPQLDAFVLRCLARDSGDRYPSAEHAQHALEGALQSVPASAPARRARRGQADSVSSHAATC